MATGIDQPAPGIRMLVDVGTNTEVVLAGNGRILAASCPAGPAFEGGSVTYGMQAAEGAIESVGWTPDGGFTFRTIGDAPALGLCGSGLIDLLAELGSTGRMTPKGVFADRARTSSTSRRGGHHVLARRRLGARAGQGREHGGPVDPAA